MKGVLLFLILSICFHSAQCQTWPDTNCTNGDIQVSVLDTLNFEQPAPHIRLIIDTAFSQNIFQVGAVQKAGFIPALSGTHALQTDTINNYPINNESAAIIYYDSSYFWGGPANITSLIFWHYFQTDTLADSCILQLTVDSGKNWLSFTSLYTIQMPGGPPAAIDYWGSLNDNGASLWNDTIRWSGNSGGWRREAICVAFAGVKGQPIERRCGFRFYFHSDGIQTNKPGWMIDNIQIKSYEFYSGLYDAWKNERLVYPNPSATGIFNIDFPENYVKGTMDFFNSFGQKVKSTPLSKTINISDLPKGVYHYSILFGQSGQRFGGSVVYR
jgi:hypothetical protein